MKRFVIPTLLGLSHGVSDCISGLIIGFMPGRLDTVDVGMYILLYNVLAFGGQLPIGMMLDKVRRPEIGAYLGMALVASAVFLHWQFPLAGIVLAGLGSALFHAGGGMIALQVAPGEAGSPGLFAAPGVIGLATGGWMAWQGVDGGAGLAALMLVLGLLILFHGIPEHKTMPSQTHDHGLDTHDLIMILLLIAIAMRSAVWNIFQVIYTGDYTLLIWIGLAAAIGKVSGGFAADVLGWRRYATTALALSAVLLTLGEYNELALIFGTGLLQSATPVAIAAMHRIIPQKPGTAAGLTLGLAILIGGVPAFFGLSPGMGWQAGGIVVVIAAMFWGLLSLRSVNSTA